MLLLKVELIKNIFFIKNIENRARHVKQNRKYRLLLFYVSFSILKKFVTACNYPGSDETAQADIPIIEVPHD